MCEYCPSVLVLQRGTEPDWDDLLSLSTSLFLVQYSRPISFEEAAEKVM